MIGRVYKERVFSENEIMDITEGLVPALEMLAQVATNNKIDRYLVLYRWDDGAISVDGPGLAGWKIERGRDGAVSIHYNYTKRLEEKS